MMNVEYADNGKKVVIPVELWETFKDVFKNIQLYELVQEDKNRTPLRVSDDLSVSGSKPEAEKNMKMSRNDRLVKIFNESRGVLPEKFRFDREEIHER